MATINVKTGVQRDEEGNVTGYAIDVSVEAKNPKQLCENLRVAINEQMADSGYEIPKQHENVAYIIQNAFTRIAYNTFILPLKRKPRDKATSVGRAIPEDF